jgi:hypothetical protein
LYDRSRTSIEGAFGAAFSDAMIAGAVLNPEGPMLDQTINLHEANEKKCQDWLECVESPVFLFLRGRRWFRLVISLDAPVLASQLSLESTPTLEMDGVIDFPTISRTA